MPLPELQTQGIDLTNTLMRIKQLEANDLQQAHLKKQNALLDLQSSPAMISLKQAKVKAELDKQRLEQQKAQIEQEKAILEAIQGHISAIQPDLEDYRKAKKWLTENPNLKVRPDLLPEEDVFLQEDISNPVTGKRFNKDAFIGWQKMVTRSAKDLQTDTTKGMEFGTVHLPDGRAIKVPLVKGQVYDPEAEGFPAGSSMEAPPKVKQVKVNLRNLKDPAQTKVDWAEEGKPYVPAAGWVVAGAADKPEKSEKLKKHAVTIYNIAEPTKTKTDWATEGQTYTPPEGWTQATVNKPSSSKAKRKAVTIYQIDDPTKTAVDWATEGEKYEPPEGWTQKDVQKPPSGAEAALIEAVGGGDKKKEKEAKASKKYQRYATSAKGQTIGWTGTAWEDVKTGKVIE